MSSGVNVLLVGLILVLTFVVNNVDSKPMIKPASSYFNICRRNDQKELNECVKKSITDAKPILKKGIPALGLTPLEPLVIPKMMLSQGAGTFALTITLTNFTIHGLSNFTVSSVNMVFDNDKLIFDLSLDVPDLHMTAEYDMDGQILIIPLRGNGNCELNFTDVTTIAHALGKVVKKDGREFIDILNVNWDIAINGKSRSWFYNLFNGDERLGNATNAVLNQNGNEAFQAIKHLPEEAFGQLFKDLSSRVYNAYSLDELYLD